MPKTRNISRSQWAAAHSAIASNSSTTVRKKRTNNNTAQEDEKENVGRSTIQTRTHRRGSILGGAIHPTAAVLGPATKKGKGKASQKKEKKLPLQDITSQFFPAPESANRGAGLIADELSREPRGSTATALPPPLVESPPRPVNASPLPPSSPPSELLSPIQLKHPVFDKWLEGVEKIQPVHDPLQEFGDHTNDVVHDHYTPSHTSSDPFGFTALERKLRQEREIAAAMAKPHEENEEDYYEDLNDIPVADTSSPRPFGLRRSRSLLEQNGSFNENEQEEPPAAISRPYLATPPTPHKDKAKHPRPSRGGHDIFSPCSSSIESSPSPTKTSASKRPRHVQTDHDLLDEFEEGCVASAIVDKLPPSKRQCQTRIASDADEGHQEIVARNLRPRRQKQEITVQADDTTAESQKLKKASNVKDSKLTKKPASKPNPSKKVANDDGDDDEVSGVMFEFNDSQLIHSCFHV